MKTLRPPAKSVHRPPLLGIIFTLLVLSVGVLAYPDSFHRRRAPAERSETASRPKLEVFLQTWNEVHMLPYTVRFYRTRFPSADVRIVVYDNDSDDGTGELALRLGCAVHREKVDNTLDIRGVTAKRNTIWKHSLADWVLIVDTDEWVDVWPESLVAYEQAGVTAVRSKGVTLVWPTDTLDLSLKPHGIWNPWKRDLYCDKPALFFKPAINDTNISPGGHDADPTGRVKWLENTAIPPPSLFHAKYFDVGSVVRRYSVYRQRMTEENVENGWGMHYSKQQEEIEAEFADVRHISKPLPWRIF